MKVNQLLFLIVIFSSGLAVGAPLNLAVAKKLADVADAYGKGKNWALSIAVVNEEGNLLYFQRGDILILDQ